MAMFLGFLIVGAIFIGGIVLVIRVLTLPGEIERMKGEFAVLKRDVTSLESRLLAANKKFDQLSRGEMLVSEPAPKSEPIVATPRIVAPAIDVISEEEKAAELFAEEVAPALFREAKSAPVPPPLPAQQAPAARPPVYSAPPKPSESAFSNALKALGPKDKNMSWEVALGTFWLPRLGALALATALVFLLSIGFQRLGPGARVAMGYGVAGIILGLGWWLDRKYPKYARVLFGAGFAMTYFVTFATYFVEFAKIFDTPYLTLGGLAAIVTAWAGLAQRRKSPVIAGVAMLVGQFTIALATYSIASPGPYSILGIVFLSIGGAFFLARNGWYAVAGVGLVASYANHFYLMTQIAGSDSVSEFVTGMSVICTYFLVYAVGELLSPEDIRRGRVPFWFRNGFVTFNTVVFLLYGTMTMQGFDFARHDLELFYYPAAAVLLGLSLAYLHLRKADPLYNTYFVKGITAVTLGLAVQFDAHTLTASLAIECALLLFAARRTGLVVTRLVGLAAGALAAVQGVWSLLVGASLAYGAEGYWPQFAEAAVIIGALLGAAFIYQRTDWSPRSPLRTPFSDSTNLTLWYFDLIAAPPATELDTRKPLDGLLFPLMFTVSAAVLYIGHAYRLTAINDWALALAIGTAVLMLAAVVLRATPFSVAGLVVFVATVVIGSLQLGAAQIDGFWQFSNAAAPDRAIPILALMAAVAVASEKRYFGRFAGLGLHQGPGMPFVFYGAFTWLLGLHLTTAIASPAWAIAALLVAAGAVAAAAIPLHRLSLAWCSTVLIVWATWRWNVDWRDTATQSFLFTAWIAMAVAFALERYFARLGVKYTGDVLVAMASFLFVPYVFHEVPAPWIAAVWVAGAAAFLAYSGVLRIPTGVLIGIAILVAASLRQVVYTYDHAASGAGATIVGFAAAAALWIALERTMNRLAARMNLPLPESGNATLCGLAAGVATVLLVLMLARLPQLSQYYLTISWSILGMALFGIAIGFREKLYRYCGLAVLALASVRVVFIDTQRLELIQRVLAWGGLGIVLLILGFGYVKVFARNTEDQVPPDSAQ